MISLRRTLILVTLSFFSSFGHAKELSLLKPSLEVKTPYGPFTFQNLKLTDEKYGSFALTGEVANGTDRAWRYAKFDIALHDNKGELVKVLTSAEIEIKDFKKGETRAVSDLVGNPKVEVMIESVRRPKIADFDLNWSDKDSFFDSHYVLTLTKPAASKELKFEDNVIAIQFEGSAHEEDFTLRNKSENPIKRLWDQASFIDFAGTSHRVIHKGIRLIDRDKPESPTTIPPTASIDDLIYPADYVEWLGSSWSQPSMLPPSQDAPKYKGQQYSIFLPIEINGQTKNYLFTIKVDDVQL